MKTVVTYNEHLANGLICDVYIIIDQLKNELANKIFNTYQVYICIYMYFYLLISIKILLANSFLVDQ